MNRMRWLRGAALLWLALSILLGTLGLIQRGDWIARLDSDLFALLPRDQRDARAEAVLEQLARSGERQLVLMLSSPDADQTRRAALALRSQLAALPLQEESQALDPAQLRDLLKPYRAGLASQADRQALQFDPLPAWTARAASLAFAPLGTSGLPWNEDPYGLFGNWLLERAASSPLRPVEGLLQLADAQGNHVILNYRVAGSAFSLSLQEEIDSALSQAIAALRATHADVTVQRAGVLVHAANAARAAQSELSLIANGSTLGIILITLLSFRGWRALPLMLLPIAIGSLWAVASAFLLYQRVHLITLVFGASLIGVAVDYAEHALGSSIDSPMPAPARYRKLLPGMLLALSTTVLAYLGLLLTPFPGLSQMAVFAAIGICAAWLSVMLWYPFIAPKSLRAGPASGWLLRSPQRFPLWPQGWRGLALALVVATGLAHGIGQLRVNDDIRALSASSPALLAEHGAVAKVLGLPSPAQFFLISADSAEAVLRTEEMLTRKLRSAVQAGDLQGYQAISDWLPAQATQRPLIEANLNLLGDKASAALRQTLDMEPDWRPAAAGARLLDIDTLLASPLAPLLRPLWPGQDSDGRYASVILLKGLASQQAASRLAALAGTLGEGRLQWVDKPARISELFGEYRQRLLWVCALAFALSLPLLWWRFGRDSWRVMAPVLIASAGTLALMGWIGMPLQLLNVLALLIILGMGVDYGVFIVDAKGDPRAFIATLLAASTTVLSFGLLAFSSTPALRSFGFAIFAGVGLAALSAPLFRHRMPAA